MIIKEIKERNKDFIERLINIWERSVSVSHLFLSKEEITNNIKSVPIIIMKRKLD